MKIRYRGHEVEFSTKYRPNMITVDGKEYSMERYAAAHGYNWSTNASGNILYYAAADGAEISVPQKRFQMEAKNA